MVLNSQKSTCFCLTDARMKGAQHHAWCVCMMFLRLVHTSTLLLCNGQIKFVVRHTIFCIFTHQWLKIKFLLLLIIMENVSVNIHVQVFMLIHFNTSWVEMLEHTENMSNFWGAASFQKELFYPTSHQPSRKISSPPHSCQNLILCVLVQPSKYGKVDVCVHMHFRLMNVCAHSLSHLYKVQGPNVFFFLKQALYPQTYTPKPISLTLGFLLLASLHIAWLLPL